VLAVRGLSVRFGSMYAVRDVNLTIGRGVLSGLIGPNGAGKTTFTDALTGFVTPCAGTVDVDGVRLDQLLAHQRARAGLSRSFQHLELFLDLTVDENLRAAAWASGRGSPQHYGDLIEFSGLGPELDREVGELSHGRQRWVGVCRALAACPSVVVLDEPAAGLDSDETAELGERLTAIVSGGVTMLLIEHDMTLVSTVCDELTVLDFGKVIASGPTADVLTHPAVQAAYLGAA
jgi:branched-chain amino acid transport system ATP-binding protein